MMYNNRKNGKGGGVAILVKDNISFKKVDNSSINIENEFETIFIETKFNNKTYLIGEIYRTPNSNVRTSINRYEYVINKCQDLTDNLIIGTDQNMDFLKIKENLQYGNLLTNFISDGLLPTINLPTRITPISSTLIDNIYVTLKNFDNLDYKAWVFIDDTSDHYPIFVKLTMYRKKPANSNI